MTLGSGHHSRLELACEPSATRYALQHARDALPRWGMPRVVTDDALLIVDELITNAVRHAGGTAEPFDPGRGQPRVRGCELTLLVVSGQLSISVYDQNSRCPVLRDISLDAEGGRGLQLVAGLSDGNWGYLPASHRPGKLVWARLAIPGGAAPRPGPAGTAGQDRPQPTEATPAPMPATPTTVRGL